MKIETLEFGTSHFILKAYQYPSEKPNHFEEILIYSDRHGWGFYKIFLTEIAAHSDICTYGGSRIGYPVPEEFTWYRVN
jgi:hypothetical protein